MTISSTTQTQHIPDSIKIKELEIIVLDRVLGWYRNQTPNEAKQQTAKDLQNDLWTLITDEDTRRSLDETHYLKFDTTMKWNTFDTAIHAFVQMNDEPEVNETANQVINRIPTNHAI